MTTIYRSKIDSWLLFVIIGGIVLSLSASIIVISDGVSGTWWLLLLSIGLGIVLPLWILLSTRYILQPEHLTVRCGPFKWQIPIAEITSITPTRIPLSSPALSLDRLRIDYGRDNSIMISPYDKTNFIRDVESLRRDVR